MNADTALTRFAAALCLGLAAQAALADDEQPLAAKVAEQTAAAVGASEVGGVALALTQDATSGATAWAPSAAALAQPHATQSMLWARRQALSVGVGVEQRSNQGLDLRASPSTGGTPTLHSHRVLIGVALATSERTSVALQAPVWADQRGALAEAPARMSLRSRDPLGDLRVGMLMKMKMSEQTTLALRPRKGGVGVTLRSQW